MILHHQLKRSEYIMKKKTTAPFHTTREEIQQIERLKSILPSYTLAFTDLDFLLRDELRPVRLQLELLRPELALRDHKVENTIVFFGSARTPEPEIAVTELQQKKHALVQNPDSAVCQQEVKIAENVYLNSLYLNEATKLAKIISNYTHRDFVVLTGGGPGFMRAANRGAFELGKRSVSLGVMLPNEQVPNEFIDPDLTFQFHYFALRKMHFLMRAKAMLAFPGGFGTMDELFETLTLIQTQKIDPIPVLLFNKKFWDKTINFQGLVEQGTISADDLNLFIYVETAEEAWAHILEFYELPE